LSGKALVVAFQAGTTHEKGRIIPITSRYLKADAAAVGYEHDALTQLNIFLSEIAQACDEYHIDTVNANQIDSVYIDKFNACAVTAFGADWNRGTNPDALVVVLPRMMVVVFLPTELTPVWGRAPLYSGFFFEKRYGDVILTSIGDLRREGARDHCESDRLAIVNLTDLP
jgi:hypothetical protein